MKTAVLLILAALASACGRAERTGASVKQASALDQMEVAFVGGYLRSEIKARMDAALRAYGVARTEDNYKRYGSVLVRLRKDFGGG